MAATPGRRGEKRWRFTHQGVVYITDETMRHEITSWRLDGGEAVAEAEASDDDRPTGSHVVLVVDHSGSMRRDDDGSTRAAHPSGRSTASTPTTTEPGKR